LPTPGEPHDPAEVESTRPSRLPRARRAQRTATAIAKVYLGYKGLALLDRGRLRPWIRSARRRWHSESARTLHDTAIDLGGLLLKAGQFLSTRTDIVPPAYAERLARLQDRVPPHPYRVVRAVIAEELGAPPEQVFERFWRRPIASASLAQVHRARLPDGRDVAVKVQRPEAFEAVYADLRTLRLAVDALEKLEGDLGLRALLEELEHTAPDELDFVREAENAERLAAVFADDGGIWIPRAVPELVRRRLVVSEFVPGIKITDLRRLARARIDPEQVAERLLHAYAVQILRHRFFHADPHPGNLLVVPAEAGFRLAFVDFGVACEVPETFAAGLFELGTHAYGGDVEGTAAALRALGLRTRDPESPTLRLAAQLVIEGLRRKLGTGDAERVRALGSELARLLRDDHGVRMPPHLFLMGRVLGLLSGVASALGSRLELWRTLLPYLLSAGARS
jgi:predicted unusual protein kinase regulating ubiquinone biosynthesis (AarF/ABC1/UbiB family)